MTAIETKNLQLARAQTVDRLETENSGVLALFVRRALVEWTTLDEAAAITLELWVLLCGLVVVAILWPRGRRGLRPGIGAVAVLLALAQTIWPSSRHTLGPRSAHWSCAMAGCASPSPAASRAGRPAKR